jgi:hypothetical protein
VKELTISEDNVKDQDVDKLIGELANVDFTKKK